ncbi:hypothetical protein [Oceanibaculum indicum]|uniref:Uncharacterized protein n=1 Tax=Oceanibaculum indicum TaxID=526216 RepID=A0A420WRK5_9PROT|nr:hypothetical protein [Oceanibaculum indicum]RKQ73476.1 hypothetical protein BCL74_1265 [Oceanibaculum indicum]
MEAPDISALKAAREQLERIAVDFSEPLSQIGEAVDVLRTLAGGYEAGGSPDGFPAGVRLVGDHIERRIAEITAIIERLEAIDAGIWPPANPTTAQPPKE